MNAPLLAFALLLPGTPSPAAKPAPKPAAPGHFISGGTQARTSHDGTVEMDVPQGSIEVRIGKGSAKVFAMADVPPEGVAALEATLPPH